jgi:hypothetical protein
VNKKEAKKTLTNWDRAFENARVPDSKKFFASFFQKRRASLPCRTNRLTVIGHVS